MRKVIFSAALMAAFMSASAQKLNFVPYTDNAYLMGTAMSNNGKYVGGSDRYGNAFIYNTETGELKYYYDESATGDESHTTDSDIRYISNDGTGVGYVAEKAAKFDFATGKYEQINLSNDANGLFNYIASDGSMSGQSWGRNYYCSPIIVKDNKEIDLPLPTTEWLGYENMGACVREGNSDGTILMGYIIDNFASLNLAFWAKNANDDNYSLIPVGKKYFDGSFYLDGPQPYMWFEGTAISSNGKWASIAYKSKDDPDAPTLLARYDVTNDTFEPITYATSTSEMYATSIADDGTMVGYLDQSGRKGFIVKGNETEAKLLADIYPEVKEWATLDAEGFNTPCKISPDGRYIQGFGQLENSETAQIYATYWFDTEGTATSIKNATDTESSKVKNSYTIDGRKTSIVSPKANSILINKYENGNVKKILK